MNKVIKHSFTATSDFKKLIEKNDIFIDKTLLIKEFIENKSEVILLPRPRRFGKTLNMSMLSYFFDINENSKDLFSKFNISKENESLKHMNQYPVISLSFKGSSTEDWEVTQREIETIISEEYKKHAEVKDILDKNELKKYESIEHEEASLHILRRSILDLSNYLERKYNKKVIIIVDEYDAAMHKMYGNDNFNKCMDLFRGMYEYAFKGNSSLHKGLLTGILQVAKEGIFSGLNNVKVYTVLDNRFSEHFGFIEEEIRSLIEEIGLSFEKAKEWYNGYKFGELTIYNPWSILSYLTERKEQVYWKNTGLGSQKIIFDALKNQRGLVDQYIKDLLEGKSVIAKIQQGLILQDIKIDRDAFWSLMLYSGYLTNRKQISDFEYELVIPNREVEDFYIDLLKRLSLKIMGSNIMEDLIKGNTEEFEEALNNNILRDKSFRDSDESFYHGMIYAMSKTLQGFEVVSNVESGDGIMDIMLRGKDLGMVIEVKKVYGKIADDKIEEELDRKAEEALKQIKDKRYHERLDRDKIKLVGIAFKGKKCKVLLEDIKI